MRKTVILLTIAMLVGSVFGLNLTNNIPEYMPANTTIYANLNVNSSNKFDVVILLPHDFTFLKQSVNASQFNYWFEEKMYKYKGSEWVGLHWHFNTPGNYEISLIFIPPYVDRLDKYEIIYTTETGEFSEKIIPIRIYTGNAPPPICGNGVCEPGENMFTCPSDCGGTVSYVMDILIVVGVALSASVIMLWYMKHKKFEQELENMYNIDKLIAYIKSAFSAKIPEWKIKQNLYSTGWDPQVIDYIINKFKRGKL